MKWKRRELREYFRDMQKRLHGIDASLLTMPNLTQWGYFLNIDGAAPSPVYPEAPGEDVIMVQGEEFSFAQADRVLARYADHTPAVVEQHVGNGKVLAFGFLHGYAYVARHIPHVPLSEKNHELYPLCLSRHHWVKDALANAGLVPSPNAGKDIETAAFAVGEIVVNHSAYPRRLRDGRTIAAKSAAFIPRGEDQ